MQITKQFSASTIGSKKKKMMSLTQVNERQIHKHSQTHTYQPLQIMRKGRKHKPIIPMVEIFRPKRSSAGEEVLFWALRLTGDRRQSESCSEARRGPKAANGDLEKLKERTRFIEEGEGEDRILENLSLDEEALRRADDEDAVV